MEILNSGSFVPLDNREKIDQLIYTARELATEASRADGFQNSGQNNHQLGLEMWKGAEYICRAHEESNIRNLFLSKFLERLREIEKESANQTKAGNAAASQVHTGSVRQPAVAPVSVQPPQPLPPQAIPEEPPRNAAQDEYLGVIPADDQAENERPSYADECVPECDADIEAIVERLENENPDLDAGSSPELVIPESAQPEIGASIKKSATDHPVTTEQSASSDITAEEAQPDTPQSVESESIEAIVLAEKEPYNLDACTVTAVIQVLPENSGLRKCVVSLRTHDFAPMVAVSEAGAGELIPHISAALRDAFEQYRIDLPAKAAEKLKKEKPAARKQAKSGSKSAKATTVQSKTAINSETATVPSPETDQSQQGLFSS